MLQHQPTFSSLTRTNVESVVSVADDLVSDRSIWRKIVCIILCLAFLLNAWIVIVLHVTNFTNETVLESVVSVVILLFGQYLATGIIDGYWHWKRWKASLAKSRSRQQEENKEAWVCMRITFVLLGLAPVSRYMESLITVRRLLALERIYLAEAVEFAKEVKQPSNLPSGSLLSAPTTVHTKHTASNMGRRSSSSPMSMDANRMQQLDAGLIRVYKIRRQFLRTQHDAAVIALASGVLGAGPFIIAQGVLFFRRVGMNYFMTMATSLGILSCTVIGIAWLCAGLTHYYPAAHEQTEVEFERGVGQVPFGGLILLYSAHTVHVTLRISVFVLFTAQFYTVVLGVMGFHILLCLITLLIARSCTRSDYVNPGQTNRSSISENILADIAFAYTGLFEFTNANAKYTRTRYFIFYLFYYLENASMIGVWYVYFTFPEVWYYLPALLVITVAQFLGFILFQVYLYLYSRPRRKTTLCGLCFRHRDPSEAEPERLQLARTDKPDGFQTHRSRSKGSSFVQYPSQSVLTGSVGPGGAPSMRSGLSGRPITNRRSSSSGLQDPVFGQQITQAAVPKTHRSRNSRQSIVGTPSNISIAQPRASTGRSEINDPEPRRLYKHFDRYQAGSGQLPVGPELELPVFHRETSKPASNLSPISAEEEVEVEMRRFNHRAPPRANSSHVTRNSNTIPTTAPQNRAAPRPSQSGKGVFQPRPVQNRNRWPHATNTRP